MIEIGGYNNGWPVGSIFANEGQRLYDLIREHKPKKVIEIGALYGCSTTWIATALRDNGFGKLISIDHDPLAWSMFNMLEWGSIVTCKIKNALEYEDECDILFEDGDHTTGFTETILKNIKAKIVIVHDYSHRLCDETVKPEFEKVLGVPDEIFFEPPSDCGLAIKYL